jgi:predicted transcriptional regulator
MKRKTAHLDVRVEPGLIERIDAWRRGTPLSRTAAIEQMIQSFLEREESEGISIGLPRRFEP